MGLVLQILGYVAAISLQVMILQAMRRDSAWKRYPFVFLYVVVDLITNLLEIQPTLMHDRLSPVARKNFLWMYWWNERLIQATLFLLVISLIYRASTYLRPRRALLILLISGSIVFALLSLLTHYNPDLTTSKWMTPWTRDMNFCAAILDLLLWATLIRSREKDQRVLMISGALGLQFTAGAIGQALRDVSHGSVDIASVIIVGGNLACLYIWRYAFRMPERRAVPAAVTTP